jgi:hypothetical protein
VANKVFDRVKVVTGTTGVGTLTLGAAINGFEGFTAAGAAESDNVAYVIEDGYAWEIGWGQVSGTGTLLTRNLIRSSTGALLNLSGNAIVYSAVSKVDFDGKADANHNHDATYQPKSTILANITASAGAGFLKRDAAGAITVDGGVYALASDVAANYQPKGSYALLTGAAFTGGVSATSLSSSGNATVTGTVTAGSYALSDGSKVAIIAAADGGMEVGGYIDLHSPTADGADYRVRIQADASGSLFLDPTSDVLNVWATNLYLGGGTQNLLLQHDGTNGYVRTQLNKGHLYLGANGSNVLAIGSGGNVTLQQNGKGFAWMDTGGTSPSLTLQTDNNLVLYTTTNTGGTTPIWSVFARQASPTFNINTPTTIQNNLTVNSNNGGIYGSASAGAQVELGLRRSNSPRWNIAMDAGSETGSNVASNLYFGRFNDAGAWIDNCFYISRQTGDATFAHALNVVSSLNVTAGITSDFGGNVSGANIHLSLRSGGSGGTSMNFVAKAGVGNWNPIVQDGDSLLWWTKSATSGTGSLVLAPWSSSANGLRIDANGTLNCIASAGNQLILKAGNASNPSLIMRNDASNFYFLLSAASTDPSGAWNALRPFTINMGNGDVTMAHTVTCPGALNVTNNVATFSGGNGGVQINPRDNVGSNWVNYNIGGVLRWWNGTDRVTIDANGNLKAHDMSTPIVATTRASFTSATPPTVTTATGTASGITSITARSTSTDSSRSTAARPSAVR